MKKPLLEITPAVWDLMAEGINPAEVIVPVLLEVDQPSDTKDFIMQAPVMPAGWPERMPPDAWKAAMEVQNLGVPIKDIGQPERPGGIVGDEIHFDNLKGWTGHFMVWRENSGHTNHSLSLRVLSATNHWIQVANESGNLDYLLRILRFAVQAIAPRVRVHGTKNGLAQAKVMMNKFKARTNEAQDPKDFIAGQPDAIYCVAALKGTRTKMYLDRNRGWTSDPRQAAALTYEQALSWHVRFEAQYGQGRYAIELIPEVPGWMQEAEAPIPLGFQATLPNGDMIEWRYDPATKRYRFSKWWNDEWTAGKRREALNIASQYVTDKAGFIAKEMKRWQDGGWTATLLQSVSEAQDPKDFIEQNEPAWYRVALRMRDGALLYTNSGGFSAEAQYALGYKYGDAVEVADGLRAALKNEPDWFAQLAVNQHDVVEVFVEAVTENHSPGGTDFYEAQEPKDFIMQQDPPGVIGWVARTTEKDQGPLLKGRYFPRTTAMGASFARYLGDARIYRLKSTWLKGWPDYFQRGYWELVPIFHDPRKYGDRALKQEQPKPLMKRVRPEDIDPDLPFGPLREAQEVKDFILAQPPNAWYVSAHGDYENDRPILVWACRIEGFGQIVGTQGWFWHPDSRHRDVFTTDEADRIIRYNGTVRGNKVPITEAMSIEQQLIRIASTIRHCGDYGVLYYNPSTRAVHWTAGDGDGPPEGTDLREIERMLKLPGITHVEIGDEWSPDEDEGWVELEVPRQNHYESLSASADLAWTLICESPTFKTLKASRQSLSPEEKKEVGEAPVWKATVAGATWYVSNTHRCFQAHKSLSAAKTAYWKVVEPSG